MAHLKIKGDYEVARTVLGAIYKAYEEKEHPFNSTVLPQRIENIPEGVSWGSKEHAVVLFNFCLYMRGRIDSESAIKGMKKVYEKSPDMYSIDYMKFADEEVVSPVLRQLLIFNGLGFNADQISKHWILNKKKIAEHWHSDPRNIFMGVNSYEEAVRRLKNNGKFDLNNPFGFYGFREKMVSMLVYFYIEAGIIKPFRFPPPVDFHVLRILFSNQILTVENYKPGMRFWQNGMTDEARKILSRWIEEEGKDSVILSNALWLLSRDLCDKAPGNISTVSEVKDGRNTKVFPKEWKLTKTRIQVYSEKTCFVCPLRDTCKISIPSAPYYINGLIELRGDRPKLPVQGKIDI